MHFFIRYNMKLRLTVVVLSSIMLAIGQSRAQSLPNFDSLIVANASFLKGGDQFEGKAWNQIIERARNANYVLIGEDHFISEVPLFTQALVQSLRIDNYICEIDQWMLDILKNKINTLSDTQLEEWVSSNYNGFSFFQKENEFELLRNLIKQKINLIGIEQVGLMSTTILIQYLADTGSSKNKKVYEAMRDSSTVRNEQFFKDFSKPYFLATSFFEEAIGKLDRTKMTKDEVKLIDALVRSAEIYRTGSHRNRIKLMQSNLLEHYPQVLRGRKNVFKFGANHSIKGESYLPVIDIGTTAHVFAQGENQDSYHILVLPKSGYQAGFLGGSNAIDLNDDLYSALKPFFAKSSDNDWTYIDLEKIRAFVRTHKYDIQNPYLEKTIKGYDVLVVIPVASAAASIK